MARIKLSLLAVFWLLSSSCVSTRWQTEEVAPARLLEATHPSQVRVVTRTYRTIVLSDPQVVGDSITGLEAGRRRSVALSSVTRIDTLRSDGAGPGVVGGSVLLVMLLIPFT